LLKLLGACAHRLLVAHNGFHRSGILLHFAAQTFKLFLSKKNEEEGEEKRINKRFYTKRSFLRISPSQLFQLLLSFARSSRVSASRNTGPALASHVVRPRPSAPCCSATATGTATAVVHATSHNRSNRHGGR
jgi:hypothetical protein